MNNKIVGNNYERECAKRLSEWLTGSKEKLVCWRDVSSGTLSTVRKNKNMLTAGMSGDFQCLDPEYISFFNKFYVDSKSLTKINLLMINKKNQKSNKLLNEWIKVCEDSWKNDKIAMMLVKVRDNKSISDFIMLSPFNINLSAIISNKICSYIDYYFKFDTINQYDFKIFMQDEFFSKVDWKSLI